KFGANGGGGARPGKQFFIADFEFPVIEGMTGQEIWRQSHVPGAIAIRKIRGWSARIVGRGESDVHEEVLIARFVRSLLQKIYRCSGEQFGGKSVRDDSCLLWVFARRGESMDGDLVVVARASKENGAAIGKG